MTTCARAWRRTTPRRCGCARAAIGASPRREGAHGRRRLPRLLGTATGPNVDALHGSRLRMMLEKTTDTTVRAVLYEAAGTVAPATLEAGAAELALAQTLNEIPGAVLEADPRDVAAWVAGARAGIEHLLTVDRRSARLAP